MRRHCLLVALVSACVPTYEARTLDDAAAQSTSSGSSSVLSPAVCTQSIYALSPTFEVFRFDASSNAFLPHVTPDCLGAGRELVSATAMGPDGLSLALVRDASQHAYWRVQLSDGHCAGSFPVPSLDGGAPPNGVLFLSEGGGNALLSYAPSTTSAVALYDLDPSTFASRLRVAIEPRVLALSASSGRLFGVEYANPIVLDAATPNPFAVVELSVTTGTVLRRTPMPIAGGIPISVLPSEDGYRVLSVGHGSIAGAAHALYSVSSSGATRVSTLPFAPRTWISGCP